MAAEHPVTSETRLPFTASVRRTDTGWLTIINLGEGAVLTREFEDAQRAFRYPTELAAWLKGRTESP